MYSHRTDGDGSDAATLIANVLSKIGDLLGRVLAHGDIDDESRRQLANLLRALNEASAIVQEEARPAASEADALDVDVRGKHPDADVALWRQQGKAWAATFGEQRQRMILDALRTDRLTLGEIAERITREHEDRFGRVCDSMLRGEVGKMIAAGALDRVRDDFRNKPRYRYFRWAGLSGPIADLQTQFDKESEA